jgi:hypothetical protein
MGTKKSASSRPEKLFRVSEPSTKPLTERQRTELRRLADMPDAKIDYSDAPEVISPLSEVQIGRFYGPAK